MTKVLTLVEIDISYCSLIYGSSPCTAALGVTGSDRCYNTLATCQDTLNFSASDVTLRFCKDIGQLPSDIEAIPSLVSVSFSPGKVSLGEDLGERASLTVQFRDHPSGDTLNGLDKYHSQRNYNPFTQGTFWGKFRARQPYMRGRSIRLIRGVVGETLAQMNTRHYVIDSFNGPTPDGIYTIVAKDILKAADSERAQAPAVSNGALVGTLAVAATSATLTPSGIGNAEYPASGYVAIGGKEICSFTRSGDVLTLVRAQFETDDVEHAAEERVQLCLYYQSVDPATIIYDLLSTYAGINTSYLPVNNWLVETGAYYGRDLTAMIPEPTPVNKLVSEIIQDAALAVWWDDVNEQVRLQVLRAISSDAYTFTQENTIARSLRTQEQPNTRISQVWTYYGRRNPLVNLDEKDNYKSALATIDSDSDTNYGSSAIKTILSRWIPTFGKNTAQRINDLLLARYKNPPRQFQFEVFRHGDDDVTVDLGQGYQISGWSTQDASGAVTTAPVQVTRLNITEDKYIVEAEEILITEQALEDVTDRTIIIDSNTNNVNMRTLHDNIYPDPEENESPSITVTCVISAGVIVGSTVTTTPAFDVGTWPVGVMLNVQVLGRIQGCGGAGGDSLDGNITAADGEAGGTALYTRENISLDLDGSNGEIWGGGGGGAAGVTESGEFNVWGGGGGGGQGQLPGTGGIADSGYPGEAGTAGTTETAGTGGASNFVPSFDGAAGGTAGAAGGEPAVGGYGGAAGVAVDGNSYVTYTNGSGDIAGSQIN